MDNINKSHYIDVTNLKAVKYFLNKNVKLVFDHYVQYVHDMYTDLYYKVDKDVYYVVDKDLDKLTKSQFHKFLHNNNLLLAQQNSVSKRNK